VTGTGQGAVAAAGTGERTKMGAPDASARAAPAIKTKPERHVGVMVVHGIGTNDLTYADRFMRAVMGRLWRSEREKVHWQPVFWADVIRPHQMAYMHRARGMQFMTYWNQRRFVLSALADAASYAQIGDPNDSVYEDIQKKLTRGVKHLKDAKDPDRPLIIVAHSLGCHIVSTYIHDTWRDRRRANEYLARTGPRREQLRNEMKRLGATDETIDGIMSNADVLDLSRVSDALTSDGRDRKDVDRILSDALARMCAPQIAALKSLDTFQRLGPSEQTARISEYMDKALELTGARLREDLRRRGLPEESIADRLRTKKKLEQERFEDLQSLVGLYTLGCNIPVFTFRYHPFQIKPIEFPCPGLPTEGDQPDTPEPFKKITEWVNFFSPFDPLGYPLKPLSPDYAKRVAEDVKVLCGNGWIDRLSPMSHTGYWTHPKVIYRIAAQIRRVLNA
jgi:hypothetical protein